MSRKNDSRRRSRRTVLVTASTGIGALTAGCGFLEDSADDDGDGESTDDDGDDPDAKPGQSEGEGDTEPPEASISLADHRDEAELQIDAVEASVDATVEIVDSEGATLAPAIELEADETLTDYVVEFDEPLDRAQTVTARLVHDDEVIANAETVILFDLIELPVGDVTYVEAEPDLGFNYPYFAYVPDTIGSGGPIYVEPNNTGTSTDGFEFHRERAEMRLDPNIWFREIPEHLGAPFLVPVFPRPQSDPVSDEHYVHALDAETMAIDDGPLERVDRQLVKMVDHLRASLDASVGYDAPPEFHLNGYSASGTFVNRFTALHPDRVRSVTAGGVNGTLILPHERDGDRDLPYPIGVDDVAELTGDEFDEAAWASVPQFIYMGADDENDTIPYDDAWSATLREIALDIYGEDMQNDRMPYCESVYDDAGANAQFHVYEDVGHDFNRAIGRDVYEFHRQHRDEDAPFEPVNVRDAPGLSVSFDSHPRGGDTQITIQMTVPPEYLLDGKISDGSVAPMLDTGTEIDWRDRIELSGDRHIRPRDIPFDGVRTFGTERPLESGEQVTVGLMDGSIVASETVTVE